MAAFDSSSWPARYAPFQPRPFLSNGHLQTIFGNLLPRQDRLPLAVAELVEVAPAHGSQISTQVLCECHWQPLPDRPSRLTVIVLHGLEGASDSQYVVGNANKLWRAGSNVIRMNMRNCNPKPTDAQPYEMAQLTPTLYHSGQSNDVGRVLQHFIAAERLQSVALIGYSMGGNLVMKLAGDLGAGAPPELKSVVGVSPAVDLADSADALHRLSNRFYEQRFLRSLTRRFRRKAELFPRAFDPQMASHITSLREFDDRITALYSGFQSADDYYFRAAAARVLDKIAVPTLVLHASDDPFIVFSAESRGKIAANPAVTLLEAEHGGHCAFLASPTASKDGYWAEHTALQFVAGHAERQALPHLPDVA